MLYRVGRDRQHFFSRKGDFLKNGHCEKYGGGEQYVYKRRMQKQPSGPQEN